MDSAEAQDRAALEEVKLTEGQLSQAKNNLHRIVQQIEAIAPPALGCAIGSLRDCVTLAANLANRQARQQSEINRLEDRLRLAKIKQDNTKRDIEDFRRQASKLSAKLAANGCF